MAKKNTALAISRNDSDEDPPFQIVLSRWTFSLLVIFGLLMTSLASVTVYNFLDTQNGRSLGDTTALRNSATTRELEQAKIIKLDQDRLVELQRENNARKKDVDDLEARLRELTTNIKSLQDLAKEIEQRIPTGGQVAPTAKPSTTPGGTGVAKPKIGVGGGNTPYQNLDPAQGRSYTTQFSQVMNEFDNLNKSISNGQLSMASLDVQVQGYRTTLAQQQSMVDAENARVAIEDARLAQIADAEGNKPPSVPPANCGLTSPFGMRWSPFVAGVRQMHYGIDLGCFEGTSVAATKVGVVSYVGYDSGYGNRVEVSHAGGWLTLYAHNNRVLVKVGQTIKKGDIIALSGNTGARTGPHIHYEIHQNGVAVDPAKYLAVPLR